jgi:hypothetical protein
VDSVGGVAAGLGAILGGADPGRLVQGDDQAAYQGVYLRKAVEIAANFSAKGPKDAAMKPVWANQTMGLLSRSCDLFMPTKDYRRPYHLGVSDGGSLIVVWERRSDRLFDWRIALSSFTDNLGWIPDFDFPEIRTRSISLSGSDRHQKIVLRSLDEIIIVRTTRSERQLVDLLKPNPAKSGVYNLGNGQNLAWGRSDCHGRRQYPINDDSSFPGA